MNNEKKWRENLDKNSEAYKFATSSNKVCRSLAGPGTGKTFSLMKKIGYLLEERSIDPQKILIITFTNAAAKDIKKELNSLDITGAKKIHAGTLHSFCLGLLMRDDVLSMIERYPRPMLKLEINSFLSDINYDKKFGNKKETERLLIDYESAWARLQFDDPGFAQTENDELFINELTWWMKYHNAMTLGEIIPFSLKFLMQNPQHPIFDKFSYILVDEYQDLNKAEQVVIQGNRKVRFEEFDNRNNLIKMSQKY